MNKNKSKTNKNSLKKSAKQYSIKIFQELKKELLYGEELKTFIVASVKWDKENRFHTEEYYTYVEDYVYELYNKNVRLCSYCHSYLYKNEFKDARNYELNLCVECAKHIDVSVRSRIDNIKRFKNKFKDKYTLLDDRDKFTLLQIHRVDVKCNKCGRVHNKMLSTLINKMNIDFCECYKGEKDE